MRIWRDRTAVGRLLSSDMDLGLYGTGRLCDAVWSASKPSMGR